MWRKIKAQLNRKTLIALIPTFIFLWFVIFMMIQTFTGNVKESVTDTELSAASLTELSDSFEVTLQENIYAKDNYINLNGITTRALGINSLNDCQKLSNGYLTYMEGIKDTDYATSNLIELNDFLKDRGIEFLYILAPTKDSFYDAEFAPGYGSDTWKNIDAVIDSLNTAGVDNFDMNAWFEENNWSMEDVFFKTDHHWLPSAGFQTAKLIMEFLSDAGLVDYDAATLDESNWTITTYENCSLGSHGRQTGTTYAGVDDFDVYVPDYETDYTYSYLKSGSTKWSYSDNPLDFDYLDQPDYFNGSAYTTYLGGDYPLRKISNPDALCDKKILVAGDSFRRPTEYFLATQFQEVYGIDLRHYTDGTLAEYIEELQPDIVVFCSYEHFLDRKSVYTFGVSEYLTALEETDPDLPPLELGNLFLTAEEDKKNVFSVTTMDLEPGQTYTLTLDSNFYTGGEDLYIQMTLQNLSTDKAVYNRYFDANSDETQKWIFDVPEEDGTYAIYLYAGTKGQTGGVSVEVTDVKLYTGILE